MASASRLRVLNEDEDLVRLYLEDVGRHDLLTKVDQRAQPIDERDDECEPRSEGAVVTAQPFDDASTGVPNASASITGKPKPSHQDG